MGIIKTAMMSGAAVYGVNRIAKTAESRRNSSSQPQTRGGADPAYLEWLEFKRRSTNSAPSMSNQPARDRACDFNKHGQDQREIQAGRQQLYLAPPSYMPPSYSHSINDKAEYPRETEYQPLEFAERSKSSFNQYDQKNNVDHGRGKSDFGSLIDQGMNMLQARRGSDQVQRADIVGKFLKK